MPDTQPDRPPPLVIVVSGPSGVGKDAVLARVSERGEPFAIPVTMTTRPPRPGEVDGVSRFFVTPDEFRRQLDAGRLLEHAEVHGQMYGVPRAQLREPLADGRDVMMQVDVQGAATLRGILPGALFVFLVPDDMRHLEGRLRERGTDEKNIRRRLDTAERELVEGDQFDHTVVNVDGDLDGTVDRLLAIVAGERARPGREPIEV